MEESSDKNLRKNEDIVLELATGLRDKRNEDNKIEKQVIKIEEEGLFLTTSISNMDKSSNEKNVIEDKQSNLEKTVPQLDDKIDRSSDDSEKNTIQQNKLKDEKNVYHSVPFSKDEESATGKRIRESDEIGVPYMKKVKSEENAHNVELNEENTENQEQKDLIIRKEEESYILRLFTCVLDEMIKRKTKEEKLIIEDIPESIRLMKKSFFKEFYTIDFTEWENVCAFLYRYGSHGAGFARFNTLRVMRNCEEVENILNKPHLKVISIGSGPGNDAVGFCSALAELHHPKLELTFVDKFSEWKECVEYAIECIKTQNFGKVSKVFETTDYNIIQVDISGNSESNTNYFKALSEADVILMSKFFTSLDTSDDGKIERRIIKSLHEHMKGDAVMLVYDKLVYIPERWNGFRIAYEWHAPVVNGKIKNYYQSTAHAEKRFGSDDYVSSHLPVFVLLKESVQL